MASLNTCPYCGASVRSDEAKCPGCGAPNEFFVAGGASADLRPRTLEELKDFCAVRDIPLQKLRFFLGEDYRQPRAYGIYRDGGTYIVYKNKSDGSRSVRYQGPDEEYAVRTLYEKLLREYSRLPERQVPASPEPSAPPASIEELRSFCVRHDMPLEQMRFFIGQDFHKPRAFGIYQDGRDFVVYKNKTDGSRSVRYHGRDEAKAVGELYGKLLEECHQRGLYPDGAPPSRSAGSAPGAGTASRPLSPVRKRGGGCLSGCLNLLLHHTVAVFIALILLGVIVSSCTHGVGHGKDGYFYYPADERYFYHYGDQWFFSYDVDETSYWYEIDDFPVSDYESYSLGDSWDAEWGVSNFENSRAWIEQESRSSFSGSSAYDSWDSSDSSWDDDDSDWSSSDYDSWDSGDTDWDSDW